MTYRGSTVLQTPPPATAILGGSLNTLIETAFAQNVIPPPTPGYNSEYVVYIPAGVQGGDAQGGGICDGSGVCAEHWPTSMYMGQPYDLAIVPISCPECSQGGNLDVPTIGGEHEAAEGLADLGGSPYEVGDGCTQTITPLSCCGQTYSVQQLAGAGGPSDCQTINATGGMCGGCGVAKSSCQTATDCCTGLMCQPSAGSDAGGSPLACCAALGGTCTTGDECCGGLPCTSGKCACVRAQGACTRNADCCSGLVCNTASQTCTQPPPPPPPDAGTMTDAAEGGHPSPLSDAGSLTPQGDSSAEGQSEASPASDSPTSTKAGCSCRTTPGAQRGPWGVLLLASAAVVAGARRRKRTR
jgi:MYXO-CTERM domain-containing protein